MSKTASRYVEASLFDFLVSGLAVAVGPSPGPTSQPFLSRCARDDESASERSLWRPEKRSGKARLGRCCRFLKASGEVGDAVVFERRRLA